MNALSPNRRMQSLHQTNPESVRAADDASKGYRQSFNWGRPGVARHGWAPDSLGRTADSNAALAELVRKYKSTSAFSIATVLAYRGEADRAFEWLDKAAQYHDTNVGTLPVYPTLISLHSDPRWLPFLRRLGMAPEQLAAIKFDVSVPS